MRDRKMHTSGPWKYGQGADGIFRVYHRKMVVCQFGEGIDETRRVCSNAEKNARLIAAAPALLAAAKEAARYCRSGSTPYDLLCDAINEAEG